MSILRRKKGVFVRDSWKQLKTYNQYDLPPTRFGEPIWFHKWNSETDISKLVNPNVFCPMNQKTIPEREQWFHNQQSTWCPLPWWPLVAASRQSLGAAGVLSPAPGRSRRFHCSWTSAGLVWTPSLKDCAWRLWTLVFLFFCERGHLLEYLEKVWSIGNTWLKQNNCDLSMLLPVLQVIRYTSTSCERAKIVGGEIVR